MTTSDIAAAIRFEETAKGGRYFIVMPNGEQSRLTYVKAGAGTSSPTTRSCRCPIAATASPRRWSSG